MAELGFQVVNPSFYASLFSSARLDEDGRSYCGVLELNSASVPIAEGGKASDAQSNEELYLVLRVGLHDTPTDPSRPVRVTSRHDENSYAFGTADGRTAMLLLPTASQNDTQAIEDQETLPDFFCHTEKESARGRVLSVDENTGQVVGELNHKFPIIKEGPALGFPCTDNVPVVIEITDGDAGSFRTRGWITSSTTFVRRVSKHFFLIWKGLSSLSSRAISGTTRLILTTITSAPDYYIDHSKPHSPVPLANDDPSLASQRLFIFSTSGNTQKGFSTVHLLSAQAATISSEIVGLIQNRVKRIVGRKQQPAPVFTPAPCHPQVLPRTH
ncbi:hypothetical protein BKA82DRAFT_4353036 [Pisolithus tinctorius]|nr:hypothetical protein BKA82DRAFT_4353036 [Pisolithus tinctorius]